MKKILLALTVLFFITSCSSRKSFQSFYNNHKNDVGATSFQLPNFMKTVLQSLSPEMNKLFGNVSDFKFMSLKYLSKEKQQLLIDEINVITEKDYVDILRKNTVDKTKIITVVENNKLVEKAIIFNSTKEETTVLYLTGRFNPNKLRKLSNTNQFQDLSTKLIQEYTKSTVTPGFNPNN